MGNSAREKPDKEDTGLSSLPIIRIEIECDRMKEVLGTIRHLLYKSLVRCTFEHESNNVDNLGSEDTGAMLSGSAY